MLDYLLPGRVDRFDQEADARLELGRDVLEDGQRLVVASGLARRIGDAPVDHLGGAAKLGADLAHAIAEADDVVETPPGELAQVLGRTPGDVDAPIAHDP